MTENNIKEDMTYQQSYCEKKKPKQSPKKKKRLQKLAREQYRRLSEEKIRKKNTQEMDITICLKKIRKI